MHETPEPKNLSLRVAGADDFDLIAELAELDEAPPLEGDAILALIDGRAVAAASLFDGRVVADPFVPTAQAITLLALRAKQLAPETRRPRLLARLRLAFADRTPPGDPARGTLPAN